MKVNASILLAVCHSSDGDEVHIEITDEDSRVRFVDIRMSIEAFATALLCHRTVYVDAELRGLDLIGKIHENKTEFVPVKYSSYDDKIRATEAKKAVKPFEIDGWEARLNDMHNHHNWVRGKDGIEGYAVTFFRHVDKKDKKDESKVASRKLSK